MTGRVGKGFGEGGGRGRQLITVIPESLKHGKLQKSISPQVVQRGAEAGSSRPLDRED